MPGAKHVEKAKRRDVSWLARTTPSTRTVEFSEAWAKLSPEGRRYIVAHERAHLEAGTAHDADFYASLRRILEREGTNWHTAWELESYNPKKIACAMCPYGDSSPSRI